MANESPLAMGSQPARPQDIRDVQHTSCCVVGGGPGGALLALLLARQGIPVLLLEEHKDFARDFRGDTIHPSVMEILDEIGLADRLLELPHSKIPTMTLQTADGPFTLANLGRLRTRFPYIVMLPQARFLEFITAEAARFPSFRLAMGARVEDLVEEEGAVRGVYYRADDGWHEVRAPLTVGADGRFSRVRRLAGIEPIKTAPPLDVLWFRLPRAPADPPDSFGRVGKGHIAVALNRGDLWQIAYSIPKGGYQELRAAGLEALRRAIAEVVPELADRVGALEGWKQVSLLSVESSRCPRWYRPGLLLIGDAAHTMSPVGGVGINYAIQDAVVAANVLARPLRAGRVDLDDLYAVQRRREWPTRIIQWAQSVMQRQVVAGLDSDTPFTIPPVVRFLLRLPIVGAIPARLIGFGVRRERVAEGVPLPARAHAREGS